MLKLFCAFVVWLALTGSLYEYTFSTENIPKFRKIGDSTDMVQKRMEEFFRNTTIVITVVTILIYIFVL